MPSSARRKKAARSPKLASIYALGMMTLAADLKRPEIEPTGEWTETFAAYSTDVPEGTGNESVIPFRISR